MKPPTTTTTPPPKKQNERSDKGPAKPLGKTTSSAASFVQFCTKLDASAQRLGLDPQSASLVGVDLVRGLLANAGDADAAAAGCSALRALVEGAEGECGISNGWTKMATAVRAVVTVMKAHLGVVAVQTHGCKALNNIAAAAENRPKVAAAGGIEAVVAAMKAHAGVAAVQKHGCWALSTIALAAENQPKVAAAGGIEAVVAAMQAHAGVAAIQKHGCWALNNITFADENKPMEAAPGAVEAIVAALHANYPALAAINDGDVVHAKSASRRALAWVCGQQFSSVQYAALLCCPKQQRPSAQSSEGRSVLFRAGR